MMQTSIIACLLLGAMFLLTGCGDSETKEVAKIEIDEKGIPVYVTEKSKDISYTERDKEIAVASYTKKEESNESSIPKKKLDVKTYSLATKKNVQNTGTSYETRDTEISLASYVAKGNVEEEALVIEKKSIDKEEDVSAKGMTTSESNSSEQAPKETENSAPISTKSDVNVPAAASIAVVSAVVAPKVDADSLNSVAKTTPTPHVPEVNVTVPTPLKSKSMGELTSDSKAKKD